MYDESRDAELADKENEDLTRVEHPETEYNIGVLSRDIVYSTASDFMWLYLNSEFSSTNLRKREYDVCIIDEADNLLIDDALSPALIAKIPERISASMAAKSAKRAAKKAAQDAAKAVRAAEKAEKAAQTVKVAKAAETAEKTEEAAKAVSSAEKFYSELDALKLKTQ